MLALLVGLGQQGAAVHAFSHLADNPASQHQPDKSPHGSTCDKCIAYAALGSALGSRQPAPPLLQPLDIWHVFELAERTALASHPYRARAPPAFV